MSLPRIHFSCCCFAVLVFTVNATISGMYAEDEFQQTTIKQVLTKEERIEMEETLKEVLNLPDWTGKTIDKHNASMSSASQFLINIYKNGLETEGEEKPTMMINKEDYKLADESDVVMTFSAINTNYDNSYYGSELRFDLSSISPQLTLTKADVKVYKDDNLTKIHNKGPFTIMAHHVSLTKDRKYKFNCIEIKNITNENGWISLDVSKYLQHLVNNPGHNDSLYISAHLTSNLAQEVPAEDIGLMNLKHSRDRQPFMVGYFNEVDTDKKITSQQKLIKKIRKRSLSQRRKQFNQFRSTTFSVYEKDAECQRYILYINFKDINWDDRIVAPKGYNAYFCAGRCTYPRLSNMNVTNHAVVQALVSVITSGKVPEPCCVPNKLSESSLIYVEKPDIYVMKRYKDMSVKSCTCH